MDLASIGVTLSAAGLIGGVAVAFMKLSIAPLKIVIQNNTTALEKLMSKLEEHDDRLDDHGNRITKIETKHAVRHGSE